MGLLVELDDLEQALAYEAALRRNKQALEGGYVPNGAAPPNDADDAVAQTVALYTNDIGTCGECATAKASDHYWVGGGPDRKAPDVGPWEVRTAFTQFSPLTLRVGDEKEPKASRAFIHVVACDWGTPENPGRRRKFELIGWAWGHEVMVPEFWRPKAETPCWRLEQRHPLLKPLTTLEPQPQGGWRGRWR